MSLSQIELTLPHGFHDARLRACSIDALAGSAEMVMDIWIGRGGAMETYRPAVLDLIALHFWVVDQPTRNDPPILGDYVRIDMGEIAGLKLGPTVSLPVVPLGSFAFWLFVDDWNTTMYFAADNAAFRWVGEEYQR